MTRRSGALAALFLAATGASAAEPPPKAPGSPAAWERIETFVRAKLAAERIPGVAIAVADSTGRIGERCFGVADLKTGEAVGPETRFQIGSLSKAFTAALVLRLSEAGRIDLDSPVTRVLRWFQPPAGVRPPTFHQLLTHTGALPGDRDDIPSPLALALATRERRAVPGGSPGFHYSNIGYQLLGLALESATHGAYESFLRSEILQPLGMNATSGRITASLRPSSATGYVPLWDDRPPHPRYPLVEAPWIEYDAADGSILSTAADMGRWLRMILSRGAAPSGRILSEESFARMVRPWVRVSPLDPWSYGYGFFVLGDEKRTLLRHTGGMLGFTSALAADLGGGVGVVVLTNVAREPTRGRPGSPTSSSGPFWPMRQASLFRRFPGRIGRAWRTRAISQGPSSPLPATGSSSRRKGRGSSSSGAENGTPSSREAKTGSGSINPTSTSTSSGSDARTGARWRRSAALRGTCRKSTMVRARSTCRKSGRVTGGTTRPRSPGRTTSASSSGRESSGWRRPVARSGSWSRSRAGASGSARSVEPETIRFGEIVDGWAQRAVVSGAAYYRFFTP